MWPAGIEPRLRGVVAERLGVGPEDLRPDVSLTDDLATDSLDLIDLGLALEAECGVVLRRRALESVRTYGDLIAAVAAARLAPRAPGSFAAAGMGTRTAD